MESVESLEDLATECFRYHSYSSLRAVSCKLIDGVMVLRGEVPSYYLKQMAQEAVLRLEGVQKIDNQIRLMFAMTEG